ncbi:Acetylglutamate kinase [Geodia barretti]|uniref:Acetylglutamate kinase n=2 Tax=Geodia barretti TaxID=519541 RepID=A0AA35WB59_GEOBA|nr:Acetylglutamate kinase [Geodia barretti]
MQRQGIPPRFVGGLRVTDAESLEIVVAVLGGLINKELVSLMEQLGGRCIGLSGIDSCMLTCGIANPELGYVGEIQSVDTGPIRALVDSGYIPMIAPLGVHRFDGSDNAGKPLNINGDTVAGELARELQTDVAGVMDGGGRVISRLDQRRANMLLNSGVAGGGMIPKLQACLRGLEGGAVADIIDGRHPNALLDCLQGRSTGTTITTSLNSRS